MNVRQLLTGLQARGIAVVAVGDRLRWRPRDALTDVERQTLARHKVELLALLAVEPGIPTVAQLRGPQPPPQARLLYRDAQARPCTADDSYMWTWEGAPRWYHASVYPPPAGVTGRSVATERQLPGR